MLCSPAPMTWDMTLTRQSKPLPGTACGPFVELGPARFAVKARPWRAYARRGQRRLPQRREQFAGVRRRKVPLVGVSSRRPGHRFRRSPFLAATFPATFEAVLRAGATPLCFVAEGDSTARQGPRSSALPSDLPAPRSSTADRAQQVRRLAARPGRISTSLCLCWKLEWLANEPRIRMVAL